MSDRSRLRRTRLRLRDLEDRCVPAVIPIGPEFRVNTYANNGQYSPSMGMDAAGNHVIAWTSNGQDGSNQGVYAQRYNAAGTPQGSEFRVNTTTLNSQGEPSVAMNADGDFIIAWGSYGGGYSIYAQRYNAAGIPQGGELLANTNTSFQQRSPEVAMDGDGDFVVAWQTWSKDGEGGGIDARRFDATGTPQEPNEFQVNTYTSSNQVNPSVAMDATGDFVIAWDSYQEGGGSGYGIYARRYDAAGAPLDANEFHVNTFTPNRQENPSVRMDAVGDFVIAWTSYGQDGNRDGVFAKRFNADGTVHTGEFQVNTTAVNYERSPDVAMNAAGDFVIAWQGYDGSSDGVFAQRYNATAVAQGGEFQVNTFDTDGQNEPAAGVDAAGNFVIAWRREGSMGGTDDIYAQRYIDDRPPTDLSLGPAAVAENGVIGASAGTFTPVDPDVSLGDTFTYALVAGAGSTDNASFVVNGNQLLAAARFDYEAKPAYNVRVRVTDAAGNTFEKPLTVSITDVNEPPTAMSLSAAVIAEGNAANDPVGNLTVVDPETGSGDTYGYSLVGGVGDEDNSAFAVVGNRLRAAGVFDYETRNSFSIRVRVTDSADNTYERPFTIRISNVNEAPLLSDDAELTPVIQGSANPPGRRAGSLFAGLVTDADLRSSLAGLAVIGNTANAATAGKWQYSTDNGAAWFDVGAVADDATALALSAGARIRFLPVPAFTGVPAPLGVRAVDNSHVGPYTLGATRILIDAAANGGSTAISANSAAVQTSITPNGIVVNSAPVIGGVPVSAKLVRGVPYTFTATATDAESASQSLTYSLIGPPAGAFIHPDTGVFSWTPPGGTEPGDYAFLVRVADDGSPGRSDTATVTLTVSAMEMAGGDLVIGGTSSADTISVKPSATPGSVDVLIDGDLLGSFAGITGKIQVRGLEGNDRITVDSRISLPAELLGGGGNDSLTGGAGADSLDGGIGNDSLVGGAGNDVYRFAGVWGKDKVMESAGADRLDFSAITTGITFVKSTTLTATSGVNTVTASAGIESVSGGTGADKLSLTTGTNLFTLTGANAGTVGTLAFAGVESLVGGSGADTLRFLPGGSLAGGFNGGIGRNALDYSAYGAAVAANLRLGTATGLGGGATNVADVTGGSGDDLLVGNDLANLLAGGLGRDVLIGGKGADTLIGGDDEDLLVAGFTAFDSDEVGLAAIRGEWTRTTADSSYPERIANLQAGTGLPAGVKLDNTTVFNDTSAKDSLTGGIGLDWFVTSAGDIVKDLAAGETKTAV